MRSRYAQIHSRRERKYYGKCERNRETALHTRNISSSRVFQLQAKLHAIQRFIVRVVAFLNLRVYLDQEKDLGCLLLIRDLETA